MIILLNIRPVHKIKAFFPGACQVYGSVNIYTTPSLPSRSSVACQSFGERMWSICWVLERLEKLGLGFKVETYKEDESILDN